MPGAVPATQPPSLMSRAPEGEVLVVSFQFRLKCCDLILQLFVMAYDLVIFFYQRSHLIREFGVVFGEFDNLLQAQASIGRMRDLVRDLDSTLLPDTGHVIVNQAKRIQAFLCA